ncbi:DinB family protein [Granulicella sibirica]|uniref:DinB-like domain-containing protein n=1 Tax=Granulicella sibirica TaxID=2479048 RepID=A0A4Q0SZ49_9BACT|nr:DinB family protein [Granulicella sibirica]RXH55702.1 hypothetical protein GRAN_2559 [Granulicella sibirica]
MSAAENQSDQFASLAVGVFKSTVERTAKLWSGLTEEQLHSEIAPGKNRVIYILGHLTATADAMFSLLGFGPRLHPELDEIFIKAPDKSIAILPSSDHLKAQWDEINAAVLSHSAKLSPSEWLQKHTAVSEEDFAKEPHRNRFAILLGRTSHLAYHLGQIVPGTK